MSRYCSSGRRVRSSLFSSVSSIRMLFSPSHCVGFVAFSQMMARISVRKSESPPKPVKARGNSSSRT